MYEINLNSIDFDIGLQDVTHLDYLNETHEKILYEFLISISEGNNDSFIPNNKLPLILDFLKNNTNNILNDYFEVIEPVLKGEDGELFIDSIISDHEKLLRIKFSIFYDSSNALLSDAKIRELSKNFITDAVNFANNYNLSASKENRIKNSNQITNVVVNHEKKRFVVKKDLKINIIDLQQSIKDLKNHFGKMKLFRVKLDSNNILSFTAYQAINIEE